MRMLKKSLVAASIAALAQVSAFAAPLTFAFNWAAADAALGIANTRPQSFATDELKFTAESSIRFTDGGVGGVGVISAGDTFTDRIVLRVDQLFKSGVSNGEQFFGYGPSPLAGIKREITVVAELTGTQNTATGYTITPGGVFRIYYDSGAGFTSGDFSNLSSFRDSNGGAGLNVENGIVVSPSGGANDIAHADGNINLFMQLIDNLARGDFEVNVGGSSINGFVLGIADGNNNVCSDSGGTATCNSSSANFNTFFAAGALASNQFDVHTKTDGSLTKQVPEPSSVVLFGAALMGLGMVGRRRRQS